MQMLFKQRFFSWFDSYDIYDQQQNVLFVVKGQFSWGKCLHILSPEGDHIATVKEVVFSFLPRFELFLGNECIGTLHKEFAFFKQKYSLPALGWTVDGDIWEWEYTIFDANGAQVAYLHKELFQWTDTYVIDVVQEQDALGVLMFVLAIDAEKSRRSNAN